jgi:1-deoxy-D-xylulose-5-phosphate reductoisomerase
LSAANEIAVEAFLNDQIEWSRIVPLVTEVLDQYEPDPLDTLESLFENDATARRLARGMVPR